MIKGLPDSALLVDSAKMLLLKLELATKGCPRFCQCCKSLQLETLISFLRLELDNLGNNSKRLQLKTSLAVSVNFFTAIRI